MSDDAKKKILARRARFVAAAMASVGIAGAEACHPHEAGSPSTIDVDEAGATPRACLSDTIDRSDAGEPEPPPMPCLSPVLANPPDAGEPEPPPMPCLSPMIPPQDAGTDAATRPSLPKTKPKTAPQPCLSVAPKKVPTK